MRREEKERKGEEDTQTGRVDVDIRMLKVCRPPW